MKLFLFVSLGLITTLVFTSASLHIDVPGPPGRPVITDINRHGCTITWTPPRYDGGSPVTHYQVEYRYVTSESEWKRFKADPPITATTYTATNMVEGTRVEFRVYAFNAAGPSEPSLVSDPITFMDPYPTY
ncbi:fibronectin type III domain-containing protein [Gabonibacter massiliensis]|uniref:fibronectin type III domain-containing protein n=1 Tax=Gabonibacter massiliensis TaxID=1720195 RepID=UPI003307B7B4